MKAQGSEGEKLKHVQNLRSAQPWWKHIPLAVWSQSSYLTSLFELHPVLWLWVKLCTFQGYAKDDRGWCKWQMHSVSEVRTCLCSIVSNSLWPPWTVAPQAPLSLGFPNQEYWSGLHFFLQCQRHIKTLTSTGKLYLAHNQDMCFIQSRAVEFLPWMQGQSILPSAGVGGVMEVPGGHCSLHWEARRRNGSMSRPHLLSAHQFLSLSWTPQAQFSLSAGA